VLVSTHSSCVAFREAFDRTAGSHVPTDHEQDLLRAMLVFASAGLDSMAKQLVADALADVIFGNSEARLQLLQYVQRRMRRDDGDRLIAAALTANNGRDHLVTVLVDDLRSGSLQSFDELARVAGHFAIPVDAFVTDKNALRAAFRARNEISHEMDVYFGAAPGTRRSRAAGDMEQHANAVLATAGALLDRVADRLMDALGA
jgi:hypothetical protein